MWTGFLAGSAEDPPTPEQLEQWQTLMSPPENEFPAGVGTTVLLSRTDDAAVGIPLGELVRVGLPEEGADRSASGIRVLDLAHETDLSGLEDRIAEAADVLDPPIVER